MSALSSARIKIRQLLRKEEAVVLSGLSGEVGFTDNTRARATSRAVELVKAIRADSNPGLMEVFLAEYGLSTDEGVALMCLAEALLRVPDAATIDALIEDKIAPSSWGSHLGHSSSSLVNASTWALMLTGKVLQDDASDGIASVLHNAIKRVGEPVIRTAVGRAIREMGHQFVLGRTITEAVSRGRKLEKQGYTFSYDMLGEAALTAADARKYYDAYAKAIAELAANCKSSDIRENPGISVKLSALHPRYEVGQQERVMRELVLATRNLARQARKAGMGFNIDAEESDRLDLSLDVIEAVLRDPDLAGWDGFGVVVQAYGKRASAVLDWLHALATSLDRKIMVRLVKGAYWDTEIKRAQVEGLDGFPVFTQKTLTDQSYILCAAKLLAMTDRIYPQFATHNAHTVAAILEIGADKSDYEFQRLQGMGEALHGIVLKAEGTRCRIYAPVGTHRDLLAYLVRRLLENGANSSFVNQIVDEDVAPEAVAADPFATSMLPSETPSAVIAPLALYAPERKNSKGWDLHDLDDLRDVEAARAPFKTQEWQAGPVIAGPVEVSETVTVINPANHDDAVGHVSLASASDVETALAAAQDWGDCAVETRSVVLNKAADLYEENFGEFFALLTREAGKTPLDAISELREAVDFLRYYAAEAKRHMTSTPCGIFTCISPWNFPLAIFTGQIAAALAAGNGVLAKPAEATALTAGFAIKLMHSAGVPLEVLQLLPGYGAVVGAALSSDARISGVCFTGSTATAISINRGMAAGVSPSAPLIAETGGLNAMIVDSTALPEQAIRDIIASSFQSAGQRCSALRMLYVQEDIAETLLEMLFGAMDELVVGDPWSLATDVGPAIDAKAQKDITNYIQSAQDRGAIMKRLPVPSDGTFVAPTAIRVNGIDELEKEVFGPVLHIATFKAAEIDDVVAAINATGYGLTFGMHSRIDDRVEQVTSQIKAGNIYINRNQIGAIVGSQPFGGEGLSGTGPKAGGPNYVARFTKAKRRVTSADEAIDLNPHQMQIALNKAKDLVAAPLAIKDLPGPTGESNRLSEFGRGVVLCLGPSKAALTEQMEIAKVAGCPAIDGRAVIEQHDLLETLTGFDVVACWANDQICREIRLALAARGGRLLPMSTGAGLAEMCRLERHTCIDTTAAGGNASLLAAVG